MVSCPLKLVPHACVCVWFWPPSSDYLHSQSVGVVSAIVCIIFSLNPCENQSWCLDSLIRMSNSFHYPDEGIQRWADVAQMYFNTISYPECVSQICWSNAHSHAANKEVAGSRLVFRMEIQMLCPWAWHFSSLTLTLTSFLWWWSEDVGWGAEVMGTLSLNSGFSTILSWWQMVHNSANQHAAWR